VAIAKNYSRAVSIFFDYASHLSEASGCALAFFTITWCCLCGQRLQPLGQSFELLICAELVQAVNANLNRLSVAVGDTVDVFGATHDLSNSPQNP
jgi:hypothetical protein